MDPGPENAPTTAVSAIANRVHSFAFNAKKSILRAAPIMASAILVIDDDVNLQTLLQVLLSRAGYSVEFACDGNHALQKMQTAVYDAILLDLLLPNMTGIDLLDALQRANPDTVRKVIVVTGAAPAVLSKASKFPVHAVVRKPFDITELVTTVNACSAKVCT